MTESLNNGFLKVKDLKKLISDIPDDYYVTVTSSEASRHITHITSVGILKSEYEKPNRCLSFCCDDHDISEETDYTEKTLYTIYPAVKTIEPLESEGKKDVNCASKVLVQEEIANKCPVIMKFIEEHKVRR